ncbi:membrane protein [Massilia sp. JS1662]|nr:NrsF family protein [Massilia sp. JS1662]KGF80160.1 membrane protein [Massilia sp. JS1662]
MNEHDALIEQLCRDAQPVKRAAPPWRRAAAWMFLALPCGFLASMILPQARPDWSSPGAFWAGAWVVLSFCLGALAIRTAFALSIAGQRIRYWRGLAALAAAWLLAGLAGVTNSTDPIGHAGDGIYCYAFLMVVGLPMVVLMVASIRRTRSLHPLRSLAMAGLGIAATAQMLLGLCHPVAAQTIDLAMHLAATVTLVAVTALTGRRWVGL